MSSKVLSSFGPSVTLSALSLNQLMGALDVLAIKLLVSKDKSKFSFELPVFLTTTL